MKSLLTITAAIEAGTGIALAIAPSLVVQVLLGPPLDSPAGAVMGRVLAAALFSLGAACWFARNEARSQAASGLVRSMLLYNVSAVGLLGYARIGLGMRGFGLLPAMILHLVLAAWCFVAVRIGRGEGKASHTPL